MKDNVFAKAFLVFMTVGLLIGCEMGNRNVISQEREAEGFNGIKLEGVGNVNVHPGQNYKVIVTTDSNLQDRVVVSVNSNILQISQKSGSFNATELTFDIYIPELKSISLNGAGNYKINNGNTVELDYSISGAGNIDAQDFQVQNITISHSGVGNAKIWATNTLSGTLSGVGNVFYKGNPIININKSGVGIINSL
jgi:hypothetical protein